jgi:hypothetical protein
MTIIEPNVFYSDIVLGIIIFVLAYLLYTRQRTLCFSFVALGASTFFGAFYHGLYNTTSLIPGDILWSITMILYGLSSLLFIHISLPRVISFKVVALGLLLFSLFTTLINESFFYGLLLQIIAVVFLGYFVYKNRTLLNIESYGLFVATTLCAIYIQQQHVTFGLDYSHNTLFHIFQIPAVFLLYLSLRDTHTLPKQYL